MKALLIYCLIFMFGFIIGAFLIENRMKDDFINNLNDLMKSKNLNDDIKKLTKYYE